MGAITKAFTFVDATIIEASEVNANFDPLYSTLSSSVNSENLAPSGVRASRIGSSAVTTRTINDGAVTPEKLDAEFYVKMNAEVFD